MCHEELITVAGYECPETTSPQTKRMLRKLRIEGVIVFRCDDGPSAITHKQLVGIAGGIGLNCYQTHYEVVLIDDRILKPIDGATDIRQWQSP